MEIFDADNPPQTYDEFVLTVKKTIEDAEVPIDEWYPDALFTVSEYNLGQIIDVDVNVAEFEIPHQTVLETICVKQIREGYTKWYAYVSEIGDDEGDTFLVLVTGHKYITELFITEIVEIGDQQHVKQWHPANPATSFQKIVIPLRQAIVNRG